MHTKLLLPFFAGLLACHPAAQADFRLQPSPPSTNTPDPAPAMPPDKPEGDRPARPAAKPSRFRLAQGFGYQVPMYFAVRQIVPHAVEVRFGPGIDQAAFITWSGGQPWNRVLASAVRPLRIHVMTTANSVMISR